MEFYLKLFRLKEEKSSIYIDLGFREGHLVLRGHEIGEVVMFSEDHSDYEYEISVKPENLPSLYESLEVKQGDKNGLVDVVAKSVNGRFAKNQFYAFLDERKIIYDYWSY